jgi:hypothetical protein
MKKALNTEKLVNITKPAAEAAYFTAAGTALHDQPFTLENYIINLGTFTALKVFGAIKPAAEILDRAAKDTGLSKEKIVEQIPLSRKELAETLKKPETAQALVNDAVKKAQEVKQTEIATKELPTKAADAVVVDEITGEFIPKSKNKPEPSIPVEGEPVYTKTEQQMLNEIARYNPEGVEIFVESKKNKYRNMPKINEQITNSTNIIMDSIDTRQNPQAIYRDFGILDVGSTENNSFQSLAPKYQKEVLNRVKLELDKRYNENYHDVVAKLSDVEYEIHQNVKNEYNSYDNPPEWGTFSRAEFSKQLAEKARIEKEKNDLIINDGIRINEIKKAKEELINSNKSIFEKDMEYERLSAEERDILGNGTVTEGLVNEIRESISKDAAVIKALEDIDSGALTNKDGTGIIKKTLRSIEKNIIAGEAKYLAKRSKYGEMIGKIIENYRQINDNNNYLVDHFNLTKKYSLEELNNAHRLNDLKAEQYSKIAGTPTDRIVQAANEISVLNKRIMAEFEAAGLSIKELDTYFRRKIKPEYLDTVEGEKEFLRWMGEELQRLYPESNIEINYNLRTEQAIERALKFRAKVKSETTAGETEKISTFQMDRIFENMPEKFYITDNRFEVMQDYYQDAWDRLARAREFGVKDEKLKDLLIGLKKEVSNKYDSSTSSDLIEKAIRLIDTVSYRNKPTNIDDAYVVSKLMNMQTILKMGLSQIGQIPQFFEPIIHANLKSFLKASWTMAGFNKNMSREQAVDIANRATKAIRSGQKAIIGELYGKTSFGAKFLKRSGFAKSDATNRQQAAVTGIFWGEHLIDRINDYSPKIQKLADQLIQSGSWSKFNKSIEGKGIKLSVAEKVSLNRARLIVDRINRLNVGLNELPRDANGKYILTDKIRDRIIRNTEKNTNFRSQYEDMPEIFNKGPWMNIILQFKKYGVEKTKHTLKDVVYREATMGNFNPLMKLITVGIPTGSIPVILRSLIAGRDLPEDYVDFGFKALSTAAWLGSFEIPLNALKYKDPGLLGATFGDALSLFFGIAQGLTKDENKAEAISGTIAKVAVPIWGNTLKNALQGKEIFKSWQGLPPGFWDVNGQVGTSESYRRKAEKRYNPVAERRKALRESYRRR